METKTNSYNQMNHVVQNNDLLKGKFRIQMPGGEERKLKTKEFLIFFLTSCSAFLISPIKTNIKIK